MKKIFHTLFITALVASTASINSMKRLNPYTDIAAQENRIPEPLWLPDEVVVPIAAYSEPKEKNTIMRLCKQFQQCLKSGRDLIMTINPLTVSWRDCERAFFGAVGMDGAYPGGARADKYYLVQNLFGHERIKPSCMLNILGKTPLHYAIEKKNDAMEQLLVEYHADNNLIPNPDINPLCEAVYQGNQKEVKKLLALEGTNPNLALANGITILSIAAHEDLTEIVKLLLAADGIDINKADEDECTPLNFALLNGHTEVAILLIKAGANIHQPDKYGRTPLHIATSTGHTEIVMLLIKAGANTHQLNKYGRAPLHIAIIEGHHTEVVMLLIKAGANTHQLNAYGQAPLHIATSTGHTEIVKLLLTTDGININQADEDGYTPLYTASYYNNIDTVKLLIAAGADISLKTNKGKTPLQIAQKEGYGEIVKLLQEQLNRDAQQKQSMHEARIPYLQQEEADMSEDKKELMHNLEDFIDSL